MRLCAALAAVTVLIASDGLIAQIAPRNEGAQLPVGPRHDAGQSITPAYEGWFKNADGSFTLLIGYYNRNAKQTIDIPVGAENRLEPGGPDQGQPTHFLLQRQWGVFTVRVPANFGDRKLTWTLVANGHTMSVPMGLHPDYELSPLKDVAEGNTPPVLKLDPKGSAFQGPPVGIAATMTTPVAKPLTLNLWATDDAKVDSNRRPTETPVTVSWTKFRGPGTVTFANGRPPVNKADGTATTTASFGAPGEYILRAQGNDVSGDGGGGFQCCWTNVHVKVTVAP
jgi:hypothetical protein